MTVGSGKTDSLPLNISVKLGSTKVNRKMVTEMAMKAMIPG